MSEGEAPSAQLQQFVKDQEATAQLSQITSHITEVCWDKCMGTPGRTLTSREMTCLSDCARRYIESAQFITQKYAQKDAGGGGGSRY